jgi:hypothetical protein
MLPSNSLFLMDLGGLCGENVIVKTDTKGKDADMSREKAAGAGVIRSGA